MCINMMMLNESKRDDLLLPYVDLLKSKGINCTLSQLKKYLLRHFVENANIRNLSLGSNFYLSGVARYYFNGNLTKNKNLAVYDETNSTEDIWDEDICKKLNALILILRNSLIDTVGETFEQPEDFGDLPLPKLLRKYGAKINAALGIVTNKKSVEKVDTLDRSETVGNGYTFDILYSYEDATKYYKATQPGAWCITYGQQHYNNYKNRLNIHYVIFKKNGWENVIRKKGPDWSYNKPQDEYGCSLIAMLQSNTTGEPVYITSRWNHGYSGDQTNCEADHAFTKEEFFQKTGINDNDLQRIFNIWQTDIKKHKKSNTQSSEDKEKKLNNLRNLKYRQMRINGGENVDYVMITLPRDASEWNEVEKETYLNKYKQVIVGNGKPKTSVIIYCIEIEGEKYVVIVDRGRILFDTLTRFEEYRANFWNRTFDYSDRINDNGDRTSEFKWLNNMIVIRLKGDKYMLYNTRLHDYLNVGGITKFKYMDNYRTYYSDKSMFYELKLTNRQVALVDSRTNTPLKLPNGQYWCESISFDGQNRYWGREVRPSFVPQFDGYIIMVYDSSAREVFFYNTKKRRFENIDISEFNNVNNIFIKNANIANLPGLSIIGDKGWSRTHNTFLYMDGKKMSLGGIEYFSDIKPIDDGYMIFNSNPYDNSIQEKQKCWCEEAQSFILDENGDPLTFITDEHSDDNSNDRDFIYFRKGYDKNYQFQDNRKYNYIIYSKKLQSCLVNPETGMFTFQLGLPGYYRKYENEIRIFADGEVNGDVHEQQPIKTYNTEELLSQGYVKKAVIPGSAPIEPVENEQQTNSEVSALAEVYQYNIDDIKQMVLEVINKIKNEK